MLKNHKNILYSLIAIIIIFFGYWYFVLSKKDANTNGSNTLVAISPGQNTTQPAQKSYDKEFVASLQEIRYINLDTSILKSAAYQALSFPEKPFQVDYNIPVGRRNPFLPIGTESGIATPPATVKATTTATTTNPTLPNPKR